MKKVLLVLGLGLAILSCKKEEISQINNQTVEDCNCDRVVAVKKFYIIGTPEKPQGTYHCPITTINDCNKMQKDRSFNFKNESIIPKVGECYDMGF